MRSLFEYKRSDNGLLAPLGRRHGLAARLRHFFANLPPAAAPLAVTVAGGLLLVALLGTFIGRQASAPQQEAAVVSEEQRERPAAEAQPAATTTRSARADRPVAPQAEAPAAASADAAVTPPPSPSPAAAANNPATDTQQTAAIPRTLLSPTALGVTVQVAETDEDLIALEEAQMQEVEADLAEPSPEATAAIDAPQGAAMRAAITTRYVNMRAGPEDDAEVLRVVPALAEIDAEADCGWCSVTYEGQSGYIYRSFISYRD